MKVPGIMFGGRFGTILPLNHAEMITVQNKRTGSTPATPHTDAGVASTCVCVHAVFDRVGGWCSSRPPHDRVSQQRRCG